MFKLMDKKKIAFFSFFFFCLTGPMINLYVISSFATISLRKRKWFTNRKTSVQFENQAPDVCKAWYYICMKNLHFVNWNWRKEN